MLVDASTVQALAIAGAVGGVTGLIAGFVASADNLFGTFLVGIIGGVSLSAVFSLGGVPPIYAVGQEEFSLVWAAVGGLVLGFVVGRSNV
jgi:uncharacterized membrane protein YeaQ/YmgE (transglycosylase-associated protein family)